MEFNSGFKGLNAHGVAVRKPSDLICEESFRLWSKPRIHHILNCNITGISSSTQGFLYWSKHAIIWQNYVRTMSGVRKKFKFQLPDCRTWKLITSKQKTPPDGKLPCLLHITGFRCLMPSDPKKWITAHCTTAVKFESGVDIFKEEM